MTHPGGNPPATLAGADSDPVLADVLSAVQQVFDHLGVDLNADTVRGLCRLTLAVSRHAVAEEIATACDWHAAQAPAGYGMDYNGGQVVGYLGAAGLARRHAVHPPTSSDGTALNAAYFRGERHERERIAYQVEELLPDTDDRDRMLRIVRDRSYARDQMHGQRDNPARPSGHHGSRGENKPKGENHG